VRSLAATGQGLLVCMVGAFALGAGAAGLLAFGVRSLSAETADPAGLDLSALKASFRRPAAVPFPASNPFSDEKRALGERLFHDKRLSADASIACATCHDRRKGFADGRRQGRGVPGVPLKRHTPSLWNLAWAVPVFWDGRARSLEEQVAGPIEAPDEMGQPVASVVALLTADRSYAGAFASAFPDDPRVTSENLAKAIATFERTLVSPRTRFDRWIDGDAALRREEIAGFRLFAGKARCSNCHSGWAFTDYAFHDIGLASEDRGRGAVLRLPAAEHAFKTPSLREIGRSAPYMHDGSLRTLDQVVRHYENGIVARPTLSADLARNLKLSDRERRDLIAFLATLTSEQEPRPIAPIVATSSREIAPAARVRTVTQSEKSFHPTHVALQRGERLWLLNNDTRTHNIRVFDPALDFDSGAQEPGETVEVEFPAAGSFLVFCGIHPKMELTVDVGP
jgi:cytochrome c peroxidase